MEYAIFFYRNSCEYDLALQVFLQLVKLQISLLPRALRLKYV